MSNLKENLKSKKKKSNIKLGKETYGTIPIEECFKKAFKPYFDPNSELYLEKFPKK